MSEPKITTMGFIYFILGFILLLAILSYVLPNNYKVSKTVTMPFSTATVFNNVADLSKYHEWNPWQKEDPNAQHEVVGQAKTKGHKYSWNGKRVGIGSLTLKNVEENKSIDFDLDFVKPFKSHADDGWLFEAITENSCKVTWHNGGALAAGMPRLMGPMITKQLNKQFEVGLKNLEALCAKG